MFSAGRSHWILAQLFIPESWLRGRGEVRLRGVPAHGVTRVNIRAEVNIPFARINFLYHLSHFDRSTMFLFVNMSLNNCLLHDCRHSVTKSNDYPI